MDRWAKFFPSGFNYFVINIRYMYWPWMFVSQIWQLIWTMLRNFLLPTTTTVSAIKRPNNFRMQRKFPLVVIIANRPSPLLHRANQLAQDSTTLRQFLSRLGKCSPKHRRRRGQFDFITVTFARKLVALIINIRIGVIFISFSFTSHQLVEWTQPEVQGHHVVRSSGKKRERECVRGRELLRKDGLWTDVQLQSGFLQRCNEDFFNVAPLDQFTVVATWRHSLNLL